MRVPFNCESTDEKEPPVDIEVSFFDQIENVRTTMSLDSDGKSLWVTLSRVGVIELNCRVPVAQLKIALRKLTA